MNLLTKPDLSPVTWRIVIAYMAVISMYGAAMFGLPFPDGMATLVGLAVGFMFREADTRGWRGLMGALMFVMTALIWVFQQQFYQEALLGMAFSSIFKNEAKTDDGAKDEPAPEEPKKP